MLAECGMRIHASNPSASASANANANANLQCQPSEPWFGVFIRL